MTLTAFRDAVVSSISSEISAFRDVSTHGGKFNRQELKRIATQSPACKVAVLAMSPVERDNGGQAVAHVALGAFILTHGSSQTRRDKDALVLAEAVVGLAARDAWDYEHAKAPENMSAQNLFSGDIDNLGIALWSVIWTQQTDIDIYDTSELDDFNELYVKTDFAPKDGIVEDEMSIMLQGTLMSAYGQIYVSSEAATSISVAGTFQKAAGTTTLLKYDGFDMPTDGRLRHTDEVTRPVSVEVVASVSVSADAKVSLCIAKNGVADETSSVEEEQTAAGGVEVMTVKHLLELGEDDYVELWVTADDTVNVTLSKMNLVAVAT